MESHLLPTVSVKQQETEVVRRLSHLLQDSNQYVQEVWENKHAH